VSRNKTAELHSINSFLMCVDHTHCNYGQYIRGRLHHDVLLCILGWLSAP